MYIIKHSRWKVRRHINQIKKRYTSNIKERIEEHISVIYNMFEVPQALTITISYEQTKT